MSYKSAQLTRINAAITRYETLLDTLYATQLELAGTENEKWKYDSAEGSQSVTRRKFDEIQKQIDSAESRLEWLYQKRAGLGVVVTRLRRKKHFATDYTPGRRY